MRGKILIYNHNYTNLHLTGSLNFFLHFSFEGNGGDAINSCKNTPGNFHNRINYRMKRFFKTAFPFVKFLLLILLPDAIKMEEVEYCRPEDSACISLQFRALHKGTLIIFSTSFFRQFQKRALSLLLSIERTKR